MTRILVTGGGKGVGAAIVRALVGAGHDVDFTYRSSGDAGAGARGRVSPAAHPGRNVAAHALDLADKAALEDFCDDDRGRNLFGLVHNAGQPYDALAAMMQQDKAEAAMQVNFWSLTRIAKTRACAA